MLAFLRLFSLMLICLKQDCSISNGGNNGGVGGSIGQNFGCVGVDPYSSSYSTLFDKRRLMEENLGVQEEEEEEEAGEKGTLPLFPMHAEDINGFCNMNPYTTNNGYNYTSCYRSADDGINGSRTLDQLASTPTLTDLHPTIRLDPP